MQYSKTEQRLLDALRRHPNKNWTTEELADIAYEDRTRPRHWRASVLTLMRRLNLKSIADRQRVVRVTGLGRGQEAEWGLRMN